MKESVDRTTALQNGHLFFPLPPFVALSDMHVALHTARAGEDASGTVVGRQRDNHIRFDKPTRKCARTGTALLASSETA